MNANDKIDRLIDLTARAESNGDYSAWTPDDNGHGPSFGLIQNNARVGSLGKLLGLMAKTKPAWFRLVFGCMPGDMEAFAHEIADDPEFYRDRLQLSGQVPAWQKCQRDLARTEYFDPAAKLCAKFGLVSERAHAMALDVAIQYGVGGLEKMLDNARKRFDASIEEDGWEPTERGTLRSLASLADTHAYDGQRRHKLLNSRELSDEPMFPAAASATPPETRPTLRHWDSKGPEVIALQEALIALGYYSGPTYPRFGDATEAAVRAFQAAHGLTVDGICGPATWAALDQAEKEGGGKG